MLDRFRYLWLPWLCFAVTLALAGGVAAAVILAPWLDADVAEPGVGWRLVALFARDLWVRRTALASALGLVVTAWVFFRPTWKPKPSNEKPKRPQPAAPLHIPGA